MPFKSQKQFKYLQSQHPDIAKKWREEYKQDISKLPKKKKPKK